MLPINLRNQLIKKEETIKKKKVRKKEETITKTGIKIKVNLGVHIQIKSLNRMMKMSGIKLRKRTENENQESTKMRIVRKNN